MQVEPTSDFVYCMILYYNTLQKYPKCISRLFYADILLLQLQLSSFNFEKQLA